MNGRMKVGLALGGGAAKAISHIGIIEGLERQGIPIDLITGTSMGALIGAMYASDPDIGKVKARLRTYLDSAEFRNSGFDFIRAKDNTVGRGLLFRLGRLVRRGVFFTRAVTTSAFVDHAVAGRNFALLLDDLRIEELKIPFAAVALDLRSGEEVILTRGSLRQAIAASCAIPGILPPIELDGRLLVDGGWAEAVPVRAAFGLGADYVIAVDVAGGPGPFPPPGNALDVVYRADAMTRRALMREQLKDANCLLSPDNGIGHWADFSAAEQAMTSGLAEVEAHASQLKLSLLPRVRKPSKF